MNTCWMYLQESKMAAMDWSERLSVLVPGEIILEVMEVEILPDGGILVTDQAPDKTGKRALFRLDTETATTGSYEVRVTVRTNQENIERGKGTLIVEDL